MNSSLSSQPGATDRTNRRLLLLAGVIPLALAVLHYAFAPPLLSHDSTIGLQVWQSMEQDAAWNELATPDPTNIARSTRSFVTWWSPGQYLPIGALMKLGLPLGTAMLLTSLLGAWSLAFGLWRVVLTLGSSVRTAALTALASTCTWHTLYELGFFIGGEIALLAIWPWVLLLAWRTRRNALTQCGLLLPFFLAGSMAKLSFELYAAGLIAFLWWTEAEQCGWRLRPVAFSALRLGGLLLLYVSVWQFVFARHGSSPASSNTAAFAPLAILGFAGNAPWFAATGFGSLAGRIFLLQGIDSDAGWARWAPLLSVAGLAIIAGYVALVRSRVPLLRLAGIISLTSAGLFAGLLLRGASISLEDRHLRPAGVLLLAVGAYFACETPGIGRVIALAALGLAMAFGIGSALQRLGNLRAHAVRTLDGRSVLDIDLPSLRFLESADQPGSLVYVPRVQMASLVRHGRVWAEESVAQDAATLRSPSRHGRVPSLVLVLPADFSADGRAQALQSSFVDYQPSEWRLVRHGSWDFWQAVTP